MHVYHTTGSSILHWMRCIRLCYNGMIIRWKMTMDILKLVWDYLLKRWPEIFNFYVKPVSQCILNTYSMNYYIIETIIIYKSASLGYRVDISTIVSITMSPLLVVINYLIIDKISTMTGRVSFRKNYSKAGWMTPPTPPPLLPLNETLMTFQLIIIQLFGRRHFRSNICV